jgi:predicted esterase
VCDPHPDVVDIYSSFGPFRRWIRFLPEHPEIDAGICIKAIGHSLRVAIEKDDREGGRGEWVGLMGFSQGAHLAASVLLEQQTREDMAYRQGRNPDIGFSGVRDLRWRFGILLAGKAPLSNLNPEVLISPALVTAGDLLGYQSNDEVDENLLLRVPTLHVHGMADPGLPLHRELLHKYCAQESTTLIEWEGAHRIPIKSRDVEIVIEAIYDIAERVRVKVIRTV